MISDHVDHVLQNMKVFGLVGVTPISMDSMDGRCHEYEPLMDKDYEPSDEEEEKEHIDEEEEELWDEIHQLSDEAATPLPWKLSNVGAPSWKNVWHQENPGVPPPAHIWNHILLA